MASTNTPARPQPVRQTHEGTPAARQSALQQLRRTVLVCLLWEDGFYEDGSTAAQRITSLVPQVSAEDAAALAIQARGPMKLRHAPLWVAVAMSRAGGAHRKGLAALLPEIIQRPDELTEFLALYWKDKKIPIAAPIKRGLAAAFRKFKPETLAKYDRAKAIRLRDVLFLVHAKPRDAEQAVAWKALVDGTLAAPDTWEVELSRGTDKRATWERLIAEDKLGALALLRNLRNMQSALVPDATIKAALATMDVSRVLPFRFVAAAQFAPRMEAELEAAMFRALADHPKLAGRTALVVDTSPSMWMDNVSAKSDLTRFDAAAALAMLVREICADVAIYAFNERSYDVPTRRGFALRDALATTQGSYSCGGLAVAAANGHGYDRIIVLTDGQWHMPDASGFTTRTGEALAVSPAPLTPRAYMVNLAPYRNGVGSGKWEQINGWSEAILDYIRALESEPLPSTD